MSDELFFDVDKFKRDLAAREIIDEEMDEDEMENKMAMAVVANDNGIHFVCYPHSPLQIPRDDIHINCHMRDLHDYEDKNGKYTTGTLCEVCLGKDLSEITGGPAAKGDKQ